MDFANSWALDATVNGGSPYLKGFDFTVPETTAVVNISVKSNVGTILNVVSENGEDIKQIYVEASTTPQSIELEMQLTNYKIIISAYYTTNIVCNTSGVTRSGNTLSFNANEIKQIDINLISYLGNNSIII